MGNVETPSIFYYNRKPQMHFGGMEEKAANPLPQADSLTLITYLQKCYLPEREKLNRPQLLNS